MEQAQPVWQTPATQDVIANAVGYATYTVHNLQYTYTPKDNPTTDSEDDGVVASAFGYVGTEYDSEISGNFAVHSLDHTDVDVVTSRVNTSTQIREIPGTPETPAERGTIYSYNVANNHSLVTSTESVTRTTHFTEPKKHGVVADDWTNQHTETDGSTENTKITGMARGDVPANSLLSGIDPNNFSRPNPAAWLVFGNAIANAGLADFPTDFTRTVTYVVENNSAESSQNEFRQLNYTEQFELVNEPEEATGTDSGSGTEGAIIEDGTINMVERLKSISKNGHETVVSTSLEFSSDTGEDISLSALRFSIGSYESDNESGDGSMELSLSYVHKSLMPDRNTVTTTSGRQSVFHYIPNGSFTETISAVPFENLEPGEVARVSSVVEQTHRQFLTTKLWEDDPAGGHGRITTTRLTSDSIDGEPNLVSSENSSITLSDFMIHVDPSLIPQQTNNQGDGGTSTSGGQSSSGGSSGQSQNSGDTIFEQLGQLFENIRERLEKRSSANPGVNTTGTSIERSEQSFSFSEYWTREVASVYVSPETWIIANESFNGSVVGATYESASSERTTSIEKSAEENVAFLSGTAFVLNNYQTIEDNAVTWNDHVADRYTHTVGTLLPVGVLNQPFLPTPSGTLIPQPLIPIVIEQYIGQMHYTSLSGTMTWNSTAGISEPYEHDPGDPGLIKYNVTRSLEVDAHGEADTHGTNATLAGFTSWRTTFEETNDGFASEKRSVEAASETDQTLVEKTSYRSLRANLGDPDTVSSLRQVVTVLRPIADNYYIPTGQSSLPLVTVELQSTNNPHFYSLDAFDNQDVLRIVKEFAGILPGADSNATGQHFTSGSYTPPAEETPEEGQESQAAPNAVWKSISKFVDIEFSVQNAMSFMQGFAQGFFVEGAWGTITGLYDLVAYAGNGLYNMAEYVGTYVFFGSDAASETTMGQTIDSAMKAIMEHSKVFVQMIADLPTLLGMSDRALSAETQGVLDAASDILQKIIPEILQELSELPEAERARIIGVVTGFITFEVALQVASAVFTGGVGNVLSAAAKAGKFCKWARKLATLIPAKHRRSVLEMIKKYVGCFEAETNVASYSIHGDLAAVTLAARTDLELRPQTRPFLTDGQWAAIGLGLVVALSCSGLNRKLKSDQESDDDPWQVQYHYAA